MDINVSLLEILIRNVGYRRSKSQVNKCIKQALSSEDGLFHPNGQKDGSCYIIKDMVFQIGTKGQTKIKVVFDEFGNIWTAVLVN